MTCPTKKRKFRTKQQAKHALKQGRDVGLRSAYLCEKCGSWHLTKARVPGPKPPSPGPLLPLKLAAPPEPKDLSPQRCRCEPKPTVFVREGKEKRCVKCGRPIPSVSSASLKSAGRTSTPKSRAA